MPMTPLVNICQLKYGVRLTQMNVRVVHKWSRPEFSSKNNKDDRQKIDAIELLFVDSEVFLFYFFPYNLKDYFFDLQLSLYFIIIKNHCYSISTFVSNKDKRNNKD
ncbi:hypothetical protein KSS87_011274 [Heliosperma pusillum]|nr:hypothetical protein KSS87_011274 [Heliosperma pusillum]